MKAVRERLEWIVTDASYKAPEQIQNYHPRVIEWLQEILVDIDYHRLKDPLNPTPKPANNDDKAPDYGGLFD